ncbi:hypothetical protein DFH08DRAFT_975471 [Mycena albidolilacea]|uniref:Ubiquinol-cytochrome C reductase hinge domain-containing protein n=1 Tax=Mycena albidolilacea TaxID=1033008 RepID=A0AAD6Z4F9_9AGAR|nr:hypothetical protein DFH08DRAFT_975471 [Mycena albidolilacea]
MSITGPTGSLVTSVTSHTLPHRLVPFVFLPCDSRGGTEARRVRAGVRNEEAPKEAAAEEEPEDEHPKIREECEASPACAPMKHHFEKCQEKVNAGEGYKGEDCVDEMCVYVPSMPARSVLTDVDPDLTFPSRDAHPLHMMLCSEACAAPKLFSKLR